MEGREEAVGSRWNRVLEVYRLSLYRYDFCMLSTGLYYNRSQFSYVRRAASVRDTRPAVTPATSPSIAPSAVPSCDHNDHFWWLVVRERLPPVPPRRLPALPDSRAPASSRLDVRISEQAFTVDTDVKERHVGRQPPRLILIHHRPLASATALRYSDEPLSSLLPLAHWTHNCSRPQ